MKFAEDHSGAESDDHLVSLWLNGRSENTKAAYFRDSTAFLEFLAPKGLRDATAADLVAWTQTLTGAPASKSRRVSVAKSLLTYAHRVGYTVFNVGAILKVPRPPNTLQDKYIEPEIVKKVISRASPGRDRLLIQLLYLSGCRVSEACALKFRDIRGNRITFHGKRGKVRTVVVPRSLSQDLLKLRPCQNSDDVHVFRTRWGRPFRRQLAHKIVHEAADRAYQHAFPHIFRHAHASHAIENGAPLHLVQATLGHANIATTSAYLHARPTDSSSRYLDTDS